MLSKVHKIDDGFYLIKDNGKILAGVYDSEEAAILAYRRRNVQNGRFLQKIWNKVNQRRLVSDRVISERFIMDSLK